MLYKYKIEQIVMYKNKKAKILAIGKEPYYSYPKPAGCIDKYPDEDKNYLIAILDENGKDWSNQPESCLESELQPLIEDIL